MAVNIVWKTCIFYITIFIHATYAINLGLIAGDLKPLTNPLSIRKYSRHSPVFINIHSNPLPSLSPITLPKLPSKPPPLELPKLSSLKLPKTRSLSSKLSKLRPSVLPPIIPRPLFIPPFIPPLIPKIPPPLPLLPLFPLLPRVPIIPPLINPLGPLRVPILGKTPLQKALASEIKPVTVLPPLDSSKTDNLLNKLLNLMKKGSLTATEYLSLKKVLLRK